VKFHALRACFATHLLRGGAKTPEIMKICGWTDLKTMDHYVRLAGVEIKDTTKKLPITLPKRSEEKVVPIKRL